jgi:uncharacterized damage-inducible protein DinB
MDPLCHVRFNRWATARTLEAVRPVPLEQLDRPTGGSHGSLRGTLAHIYQGDCIWWERLHGNSPASLGEFPPPGEFAAWESDWLGRLDRYIDWAQKADWDQVISYRDLKGNAHQSPVWQILLHLVNHGSYHRGQVTNLLRQLGHSPASQDLIAYYRTVAVAG